MPELRGGLVRALQEFHQLTLGVRRSAHGIVRQDEFAQFPGEECLFRAYRGLALLGEKDEAVKALKRLLAAYGPEMEASTRKDYEKRLKAAEDEAAQKKGSD